MNFNFIIISRSTLSSIHYGPTWRCRGNSLLTSISSCFPSSSSALALPSLLTYPYSTVKSCTKDSEGHSRGSCLFALPPQQWHPITRVYSIKHSHQCPQGKLHVTNLKTWAVRKVGRCQVVEDIIAAYIQTLFSTHPQVFQLVQGFLDQASHAATSCPVLFGSSEARGRIRRVCFPSSHALTFSCTVKR